MTNKIGSLIIDIEGQHLTREEEEILAHPLVGGVTLFARNYISRAQLTALCQKIRSVRQTPLLIMVDQEGGRVQRFMHEFTILPAASTFGILYDDDPLKACRSAKEYGGVMARELLSVDVDLSFAPVLDLNKGMNQVIGDRAFHAKPEVVVQLASAFMQGMREAGMASTGKHFPGHGSCILDSHQAQPIDERRIEEIEHCDLIPFTKLIHSGIAAIMTAHIIFPSIDSLPVSFSRMWLQNILRYRFLFRGVIFSDDLNMEGANISKTYSDRVLAAREAGCDFALLCNNRRGVTQVLDQVSAATHRVSIEKWGLLRRQFLSNEQTQ